MILINKNIIEINYEDLYNNMDEKNRADFLEIVEEKLEKLSGKEIVDVESM